MKVVYIAGKFRGPTMWDIAENVRAAERVALEVAKRGAMPLCPHANTAHFHGQLDEQFWLDGTLELLKRCDGILMMPGWGNSAGARCGRSYALAKGIEIWGIGHLDQPVFLAWCKS